VFHSWRTHKLHLCPFELDHQICFTPLKLGKVFWKSKEFCVPYQQNSNWTIDRSKVVCILLNLTYTKDFLVRISKLVIRLISNPKLNQHTPIIPSKKFLRLALDFSYLLAILVTTYDSFLRPNLVHVYHLLMQDQRPHFLICNQLTVWCTNYHCYLW